MILIYLKIHYHSHYSSFDRVSQIGKTWALSHLQLAARGKLQLLFYPVQELLVFNVLRLLDLLDLLLYLIPVVLFVIALSLVLVCTLGTRS